MKKIIVGMVLALTCSMAMANEPPVKKSSSGICHPEGGTYYDRTTNFVPYNSMEECIASGGRAPKR